MCQYYSFLAFLQDKKEEAVIYKLRCAIYNDVVKILRSFDCAQDRCAWNDSMWFGNR